MFDLFMDLFKLDNFISWPLMYLFDIAIFGFAINQKLCIDNRSRRCWYLRLNNLNWLCFVLFVLYTFLILKFHKQFFYWSRLRFCFIWIWVCWIRFFKNLTWFYWIQLEFVKYVVFIFMESCFLTFFFTYIAVIIAKLTLITC